MRRDDPFFITENIDSGQKSAKRWVEESFAPEDNIFGRSGSEFLSLSLSSKKMKVFLAVFFLALILLVGKSFYLQIIRGDYYFSLAESNRLRTEYTKAKRGIIYDRQGKILVKNVSGFSLLITPAALPRAEAEKAALLEQLAKLAGVPVSEINEKLAKANKYYWQPVVIKTGIGYAEAMALKIASVDFGGVSLENDYWRLYLFDDKLAHLLGYVGKINPEEYEEKRQSYLLSDSIGKTGLESYYEDYLRGRHGQKQVEVDALGRLKKIIAQTEAVSGSDLILAVDLGLQEKIYQLLASRLGEGKAASVVVSNPQNGEILALVDYPSYNNNLFATGISQAEYQKLLADKRNPLFDRSAAGEYPSGSTIKPVIAAAALMEGIINRNTSVSSVGGLWVANQWFFPDWKEGGHGITNVTKALAWSVNTFFYYIGGGYGDFKGLGVAKIDKYLKLFGLGEKLGLDFPGEKRGFVPDEKWKEETKKEPWYIGDTYHLSIGQGDLLVTPLQVNSYTATIANGGQLYRPHLVKEIVNPDGRHELIMPQLVSTGFVSPENLEIIREGMRQTVTAGSAQSLNSLPVAVAGKTGTAQWNTKKPNHAWFTAFAPYDNPTFAITVLVEEGGEGSAMAAPLAREIIGYWFGASNNQI